MIVYDLLFIKICFKEKSLYYFHEKIQNLKNHETKKKTFVVVFLGFFFCFSWVGFLLPTLRQGVPPLRDGGPA